MSVNLILSLGGMAHASQPNSHHPHAADQFDTRRQPGRRKGTLVLHGQSLRGAPVE